jgi:hypothetical protein
MKTTTLYTALTRSLLVEDSQACSQAFPGHYNTKRVKGCKRHVRHAESMVRLGTDCGAPDVQFRLPSLGPIRGPLQGVVRIYPRVLLNAPRTRAREYARHAHGSSHLDEPFLKADRIAGH